MILCWPSNNYKSPQIRFVKTPKKINITKAKIVATTKDLKKALFQPVESMQ